MSEQYLSDRMKAVSPFHVMRLMGFAKTIENQGHSVVHMEVGEPDFATPEPILNAGQNFLSQAHVHYTHAAGLPELRELISEHYHHQYGVEVSASRIFITPGASGALMVALASLINTGDEVLLSDPGYPCNANFIRVLGGVPCQVPVDADSHYHLDSDRVTAHWSDRTRGLLIASPSNPTGSVIPVAQLAELANAVAQRQGFLISDEIYHGLEYGVHAQTALAHAPDAFVLNSFSKYFGMTGWRLGWLVVPEWAAAAAEKLMQNLFIAAPTPAQYAALAAFTPQTTEILEDRRRQFQQRRDLLHQGLTELGFPLEAPPQGAFYIYVDVSTLTEDSEAFALDMLQTAHVAATPGLDFGDHQASTRLRFAYTTGLDRIELGLERMAKYLQGRR